MPADSCPECTVVLICVAAICIAYLGWLFFGDHWSEDEEDDGNYF